jgi:tetratricopeptide (TPR) repeat protein
MRNALCGALIFAAAAVFAQTAGGAAADGDTEKTGHFEIWTERSGLGPVGRQMEERFEFYNRLFRFDPAQAPLPLRVRVFGNTDTYNEYVEKKLGGQRRGAVYLHYGQSKNRELVINAADAAEARQALPYQAFLQFFRAFVPQPPAWMREGFAVFFNTLDFTESGQLYYEENLAWLETAKSIKNRPRLEELLLAEYPSPSGTGGLDIGRTEFQSLAWSWVSFFLNSGSEEYSRALTDSFMALSPSKSAADNAGAVMKRILLGHTPETIARDYQRYLDTRRTFTELVAEGQRAHAAGNKDSAEFLFRGALEQKPGHFAPYYYLGLLAYEENRFDDAEPYFRQSLHCGAEPALIFYALGLNSAAAGKNAEAAGYLRRAAAAAPERYQEKAESIISRLKL